MLLPGEMRVTPQAAGKLQAIIGQPFTLSADGVDLGRFVVTSIRRESDTIQHSDRGESIGGPYELYVQLAPAP